MILPTGRSSLRKLGSPRSCGLNVGRLLTTFHVLLALAVIASISVVGIVLVNALLVIPAATAKLLAPSLRRMFVLVQREVAERLGIHLPAGLHCGRPFRDRELAL